MVLKLFFIVAATAEREEEEKKVLLTADLVSLTLEKTPIQKPEVRVAMVVAEVPVALGGLLK